MTIWVDADACPVVIKEVLFKAAERVQVPCVLIANQYIKTPKSPFISSVQVASGFDVADDEIVRRCQPGDIAITGDIPLAAELVEKSVLVISPRGELLTAENIKPRLNMRDFVETMRSSGVEIRGGQAPLNARDKQQFANQLDRALARL